MEPTTPRRFTAVAAALASLAVLLVLMPGQAAAASATIEIKGKTQKGLRFAGPKVVKPGKKLEIVNNTDPERVGPHTFTLAKEKYLPTNGKEFRACFDPGNICNTVAEAHEVDFETEQIGEENVDEGRPGWDLEFTLKKFGDSRFLGGEGQTHSRRVSAKDGATLNYFCVIHPNMQGKLTVEK